MSLTSAYVVFSVFKAIETFVISEYLVSCHLPFFLGVPLSSIGLQFRCLTLLFGVVTVAAVLFFPGEYGGVEGSGWWGLGVGGCVLKRLVFPVCLHAGWLPGATRAPVAIQKPSLFAFVIITNRISLSSERVFVFELFK